MASKVESKGKGTFQPDSDVHITYEDQMKINKFANYNAKVEDLKEELKIKQNEMKNLEEACDEIELLDDDVQIPFLCGEVFMSHDQTKTLELLAEAKEKKKKEIDSIQQTTRDIQQKMNDLKGYLYGRFGSNIHLENDE
ncbi:probable prefoldin subunit 4 [Anopheles ziemanni]|uniref:probable prefoldin subunit 4 n=1 Tax=Anopheles coustani TaxID=139045 RepID=UPI00265A5F5C|nr:probable prefoldin subunit 4 [Anopheles coustani]XP_058168346.1 probable prefoldin subunit 4 [Anopheles ziemanni]